ncbi:MAG TPA: SRPBCC domain-containing protein [Acidimicrobiales bacterium]|nr:SRPBCC domain-containing protein [Acidimicrobiales bacterium]
MDFGSSFVVPAPLATVFEKLLDPAVMRSCIPGCEELERLSDEQFRGRLRSEIAHVRFDAAFSANVLELDAPRHLHALLQGEDKRIASSIKIDAQLDLKDKGGETAVTYNLELALWGRVGRLGEAIVRRRSVEVQQQFEAAFIVACDPDGAAGDETLGAALTPPQATAARELEEGPVAILDAPAPVGTAPARRSWWRALLARLFGGR